MIPTYFLFLVILSVFSEVHARNEESEFKQNPKCKCGRSEDHTFRIVGGQETHAHSNPWTVALYSKFHKKIFCGGALINDRYVLTAGHCIHTVIPRDLAVILGLHDLHLFELKKDGFMVDVDKAIRHEDYRTISFYDVEDIALLRLKEKVTFSKKVQPICLPKSKDENYDGKTATVLGWGKTAFKTGRSSNVLKEAHLNVVSTDECKKHKEIGKYVTDLMLCAYQDNTDACQGDSGGPLIYDTISGKVELIGVVSWGLQCAKPDTPGVYTKITSKLDWIAKHTKDSVYCLNH